MKIKILSRKDIQQSVTMSQAIDVVKQAFISYAQKEAILPLRTQVPVKENQGITLFMPAYLPKSGSLGAKIVSVFPQNVKNNRPTIHAVVISPMAHPKPIPTTERSVLLGRRNKLLSAYFADTMPIMSA